jgi:hypothetical protein
LADGILSVYANQEDDSDTLHFMAAFLLFDGRHSDTTFQLMNEEGCFSRLLELVRSQSPDIDDGAGLHRLLMDLLYEMSRIQRVKIEDLGKPFEIVVLGKNVWLKNYDSACGR